MYNDRVKYDLTSTASTGMVPGMFGKLFATAYSGSMFGAGAHVFAVWPYVIAHTYRGRVEINPQLVGAILGMSEAEVEKALEFLCSPDPRSRNQSEEGRRLVHEGGFQYRVISHEEYRNIKNDEDLKAYNRRKQRESRARKKRQSHHPSPPKPPKKPVGCTTTEDVARVYRDVTGHTDVDPISASWMPRQIEAIGHCLRWCGGDLDRLEEELRRLCADEWLGSQPIHVMAPRLGSGAPAGSQGQQRGSAKPSPADTFHGDVKL